MGWWTIDRDGQELEIGDEPLDAVQSALKRIARAYKKDMKRSPLPDEVASLLESGIRVFEEELFGDMEERELDCVLVQLRPRPKRPKPKPGDYFAVPLPTGGYGYGRIMKIKLKVLVWVRLLDMRTRDLASVETLAKAAIMLDCATRTNSMVDLSWPIVGNTPLSDEERILVKSEPEWQVNHAAWGIERILEQRLSKRPGFPPGTTPPV